MVIDCDLRSSCWRKIVLRSVSWSSIHVDGAVVMSMRTRSAHADQSAGGGRAEQARTEAAAQRADQHGLVGDLRLAVEHAEAQSMLSPGLRHAQHAHALSKVAHSPLPCVLGTFDFGVLVVGVAAALQLLDRRRERREPADLVHGDPHARRRDVAAVGRHVHAGELRDVLVQLVAEGKGRDSPVVGRW